MHPELDHIAALGPRFRLPLEALCAVRELHGEARMLEHAIQSDDATMRFVALVLTDATLALKLMTEMVRAQASGRPAKVMRVKRRLDKVLAARQSAGAGDECVLHDRRRCGRTPCRIRPAPWAARRYLLLSSRRRGDHGAAGLH